MRVQVHETSYRFLFFWLLSAKMGTKIVRVQLSVFTIPIYVWDIKFHIPVKISEFG